MIIFIILNVLLPTIGGNLENGNKTANATSKRITRLQKSIQRYEKRYKRLEITENRIANARLICFFGGITLFTILAFISNTIAWIVLGISVVLFIFLLKVHSRIVGAIERHRATTAFSKDLLARLHRDWETMATPIYHEPPPPDHPFAPGLDIVGPRSIHHLLDLSVSKGGSERLRSLLLDTQTSVSEASDRQHITRELFSMDHFRRHLLVVFRLVKEPIESTQVLRWLDRPLHISNLKWTLLQACILSVVNYTLIILYIMGMIGPFWIFSLAVYAIHYLIHARLIQNLLSDSSIISSGLAGLKSILLFIERYPYRFESPVAALIHPILDSPSRPSSHLRNLWQLESLVGLRMNPMTWILLNIALPWDYITGLLLEMYKSGLRKHLSTWLDSLFGLEAHLSLATAAWLHTQWSFPQFNDSGPLLTCKQVGHPLIDENANVRNDFTIDTPGQLTLITGSNMSGKSTFLRTIGTNRCLAFAGGPIDAVNGGFKQSKLFVSMRVEDSIQEGFSYFYAEVRRLRTLLDLINDSTESVIYLIDEVFRGTNNRERLIGSRSLIKAIVSEKCAGIIATHDLELTHLTDQIPTMGNAHFREHVENGTMTFDYRLRPGPCPTTNALIIMKMEGLPIDISLE